MSSLLKCGRWLPLGNLSKTASPHKNIPRLQHNQTFFLVVLPRPHQDGRPFVVPIPQRPAGRPLRMNPDLCVIPAPSEKENSTQRATSPGTSSRITPPLQLLRPLVRVLAGAPADRRLAQGAADRRPTVLGVPPAPADRRWHVPSQLAAKVPHMVGRLLLRDRGPRRLRRQPLGRVGRGGRRPRSSWGNAPDFLTTVQKQFLMRTGSSAPPRDGHVYKN